MPSEIIITPRQARRSLGFVSSNANEPDVRPLRYAESPHKTPEIQITKETPSDAAHLVLFIISYPLGFDLALPFETCQSFESPRVTAHSVASTMEAGP